MTALLKLALGPVGAVAGMVGVAVLAFMLIGAKIEGSKWKSAAGNYKRALDITQNNLVTCRGNTARLESALDAQNRAVVALGERGRATEREAQHAAEKARLEARDALSKLAAFQRRPIKGATACDRVEDVAAAIREDLQ